MNRKYGYNKYKGRLNRNCRKVERLQAISHNKKGGQSWGQYQLCIGFWNTKTFMALEKQETVHSLLSRGEFEILCWQRLGSGKTVRITILTTKAITYLETKGQGRTEKGVD